MDPFSFLNGTKWRFQKADKYPVLASSAKSLIITNNMIVQKVLDTDKVAVTPLNDTKLPPLYLDNSDPSDELDIDEIWPKSKVVVDMDPQLPQEYISNKYNETLAHSDPLALFPKQVLSRARIGIPIQDYITVLLKLVRTPREIDEKYTNNDAIEAEIKRLCPDAILKDTIPLWKFRETYLQILILLELYSLKNTEHEAILDHHFNRLCIWHAVQSTDDQLTDFVTQVLLPFFKTKCTEKVKMFLKCCRGTLKTGHKRRARKIDPERPSTILPEVPGLYKALKMQKLVPENERPPTIKDYETPTGSTGSGTGAGAGTNNTSQNSLSFGAKASRTMSHPLYRQASRQNTVEVRFKNSKRNSINLKPRGSSSMQMYKPPKKAMASQRTTTVNPRPTKLEPTLPLETVQATPIKDKQRSVDVGPIPSLQFDEVGSTDTD